MPISIIEVTSSRLSETKGEILIAGKGKYIGDVELAIAATCVDDLIAALNRAKEAIGTSASKPLAETEPVRASSPATAPVVPPAQSGAAANPNTITFEIPKKCSVIAGRGPKLVLLVFEGQANQKTYALPPDVARKVAAGLVQTSEVLLRDANQAPR